MVGKKRENNGLKENGKQWAKRKGKNNGLKKEGKTTGLKKMGKQQVGGRW